MQNPPPIQICALTKTEHLHQVIELERAAWGYSDLDIDSFSILTIASRFTGQLLGAFHQSRLVGFSLALASLQSRRLHSHRVGVLPEFQNAGVGRQLKLAQRTYAMEIGVDVIQWTFDPMQPRNAYFNLNKLGGIARTYIPNLYGITSSPLNAGLPTDRLVVEWDLKGERVHRASLGLPLDVSSSILKIRLNSTEMMEKSVAQEHLRAALTKALSAGYTVTGFERTEHPAYLLEKL